MQAASHSPTLLNVIANLKPSALQDVVDFNDVKFSKDSDFLSAWRGQVHAAIIGGLNDQQEWAFDWCADLGAAA